MVEEFIKIQTWQIMCEIGKSIEEANAEYAYFNALYSYKGDITEYATALRAVQLSYLVDPDMFIEDRAIMVEGMLFANKSLIVLDNDVESCLLTPKEKIKQIKEAYEELKEKSKYQKYDDFEDGIFERGIKKYVKRHCKSSNR